MATIKELEQHPETTFDSLRQIGRGVRRGDSEEAYQGVARFMVEMIAGPDAIHDASLEERNRFFFLQSLEGAVGFLKAGNGRSAMREMSAWGRRWKDVDSSVGQKNLLPESLMPIAMLAVVAGQNIKGDSAVFMSPKFEKKRLAAIKEYLGWAQNVIERGTVDPREFFGQGKMFNFSPFRSL